MDLVAVYEGEIVGHIISTKANVIDKRNKEHVVICVGPISVLPNLQNKGIGAQLLEYAISEAAKMGFSGMILFGDPSYYHRFGFVNAKAYEITTKDGKNFEPFMALELQENGLAKVKGRFFEDKAYTTQDEALLEFEKKFPPKKKSKAKINIEI